MLEHHALRHEEVHKAVGVMHQQVVKRAESLHRHDGHHVLEYLPHTHHGQRVGVYHCYLGTFHRHSFSLFHVAGYNSLPAIKR